MAVLLAAALGVAVVLLVLVAGGGSGPQRSAAAGTDSTAPAAAVGTATTAAAQQPAPLARYAEGSPHVLSRLSVYGVQGVVAGAPQTPPDQLLPVSPAGFEAPVAAYLAYSVKRLHLMEGQISQLRAAVVAGDRAGAEAAWQRAYAYYLNLGAVYLEGPISDLNDAIEGTPGGLPGGVSSPQWSGLHRIERGLWTGAPLATLVPWTTKLATDVDTLAKALPKVKIDPLDYATRAHEILEDAVRDQLSGTEAPWSGAGVLGTSAGLVATSEVVGTLAPLLHGREGVLGTVDSDFAALRTTLSSLQRAHGGTLPTTSEMTQLETERLDGSVGQALEGLAQIPGVLETSATPVIPQIPAKDLKTVP